jgi:hypothetical protein
MTAAHFQAWHKHFAAHSLCTGGIVWEAKGARPMKLRFLSRMFPRVPSEAERDMAYLNGATSLVDLEYRQREIDRRKIRNNFY